MTRSRPDGYRMGVTWMLGCLIGTTACGDNVNTLGAVPVADAANDADPWQSDGGDAPSLRSDSGPPAAPADAWQRTLCWDGSRPAQFNKACAVDEDCFVGYLEFDCCQFRAFGLVRDDEARFVTYTSECGRTTKTGAGSCEPCPDYLAVTENGTWLRVGSLTAVCISGQCTTAE